jgi:hypothetical protein
MRSTSIDRTPQAPASRPNMRIMYLFTDPGHRHACSGVILYHLPELRGRFECRKWKIECCSKSCCCMYREIIPSSLVCATSFAAYAPDFAYRFGRIWARCLLVEILSACVISAPNRLRECALYDCGDRFDDEGITTKLCFCVVRGQVLAHPFFRG